MAKGRVQWKLKTLPSWVSMKASELYEKKVLHADKKWNVKGESKVQLSFEEAKKSKVIFAAKREVRWQPDKRSNRTLQNKIATAA